MRAFAPLLLAVALAACATGPDYRAQTAAALAVPDAFENEAAAGVVDAARWWEQLGDPALSALVEQAIAGNLDIAVAATRLAQARESLVQARAGRLPTIAADAGVGETIDRSDARTSLSVGADAAWQADLFGGIGRGIEAARADAEATFFDTAAVRTAIIGEVVSNYVQLRLSQQRLQLARDTLAIADENLEIAGWRVRAGLVSSLDEEQARAQRAQTAAAIPAIEQAAAGARYRLAVLTGQAPGALDALAAPAPIPRGPDAIAVGIPADTLRQRPDLRRAERNLAAATARIGVAQAQLYPALRLTGSLGTSAFSVGGLVDAVAGSLFAGLSQTLFDGGRLRSQVRGQEAAAGGALASYRQAVLTALEDVENGLVARTTAERREREFAIAREAAGNTAILARSQYRAGLTDFQTLLEAERSLVSARDGLISAGAERTLALVQLYLALGGGWDAGAALFTEPRS